jgi:hypothetical protein
MPGFAMFVNRRDEAVLVVHAKYIPTNNNSNVHLGNITQRLMLNITQQQHAWYPSRYA